jgi:hypothetical protein
LALTAVQYKGVPRDAYEELLDSMKSMLSRVNGEQEQTSSLGGPLVSFPQDNIRMVRSPGNPRGWELRPARWSFDLERIELQDAERDELVFLLDGRDSRVKAFYAPYDTYDPSIDYEKRAGGLDQDDQIGTRTLRDAGIDTLIEESRSLIDEISPLLVDIDREHINQRILFSVFTLVPSTHMHLIRWSAPSPRRAGQL